MPGSVPRNGAVEVAGRLRAPAQTVNLRQNEVRDVAALLQDPAHLGVALVGPPGVGKTVLIKRVLESVSSVKPALHIEHLSCPSSATGTPYSVFREQLDHFSDVQSSNPSMILGGLVEHLLRAAKGLPLLLVLDDARGVDAGSIGVLIHLILGGKARLLLSVRTMAELPDDLAQMIRDGLLEQHRMAPFTRPEVRTFLSRALGGRVSEAVVSSLHESSNGNPLVLTTLVQECLRKGEIFGHDGVWVSAGDLEPFTGDVLQAVVALRLSRVPQEMRGKVEQMALLGTVPLEQAIRVLGVDAVSAMEEWGILSVADNARKTVSFTEPYLGETVRTQLSARQMSAHIGELARVLTLEAGQLGRQELLTMSTWIMNTGLILKPEVAVEAARAALHFYDPPLALEFCKFVPNDHPLHVEALLKRSRAHYILADYEQAAAVLEGVEPGTLAALTPRIRADRAFDLVIALCWLPRTQQKVDALLAGEEAWLAEQIREKTAPEAELDVAGKRLQLARCEALIFRGEFLAVMPELVSGSRDSSDRNYRLSCANLLTLAKAATGNEIAAMRLSDAITAETHEFNVLLRMGDWHVYGRILAQIWSGELLDCEEALLRAIAFSNRAVHYRGGAMELALGVAYIFSGRFQDAVDVLNTAAAQLEQRDTYRSHALLYSALACAHVRMGDTETAAGYLERAQAAQPHTVWINKTLAEFLQARALGSLGQAEEAGRRLVVTAGVDLAKGRITPAAMGLLAASMAGDTAQYATLEELAQRCEGGLASVSHLLARAHRTGHARDALEAAELCRVKKLAAIEQFAVQQALKLAQEHGDVRSLREARRWLNELLPSGLQTVKTELTKRERQVARMTLDGMSNKDMANALGVSVRTVEGHLYRLFAKLGIESRRELRQMRELRALQEPAQARK